MEQLGCCGTGAFVTRPQTAPPARSLQPGAHLLMAATEASCWLPGVPIYSALHPPLQSLRAQASIYF